MSTTTPASPVQAGLVKAPVKATQLTALIVLGGFMAGLDTSLVNVGLLVPTGQNIVVRAVGPERMGRVMSTAGVAIVLAPAIGPALGGLLIDTTSWRWLFVVNLPIGIVAAILARRVLPKDKPDAAAKLDVAGLLLLGAGLPALSIGLTHLGSAGGAGAFGVILTVVGVLLLVAFAVDASRRGRSARRATLLDISLFRRPRYATAQVTVLFTGVSVFGGLILLPLYYEELRGLSVIHTGLLLVAYGAGAMVALPLGGRITDSAIVVIVIARSTRPLAAFQTSYAILVATASIALAAAVTLALTERRHTQPARS